MFGMRVGRRRLWGGEALMRQPEESSDLDSLHRLGPPDFFTPPLSCPRPETSSWRFL